MQRLKKIEYFFIWSLYYCMIKNMQFQIIDKNDEHFEIYVKEEANTVWIEAFGNEYSEGGCPGDSVVIGRIDSKPVCAAIIKFDDDKKLALVSCMGSNPQKCGYGSSLIRHIVDHLKTSNIIKTYVKIDKDDKADRLEKFYSNFGFAKDEVDVLFILLDYDIDVEFVMSCDLNLDLDLDLNLNLNNLQIVS